MYKRFLVQSCEHIMGIMPGSPLFYELFLNQSIQRSIGSGNRADLSNGHNLPGCNEAVFLYVSVYCPISLIELFLWLLNI